MKKWELKQVNDQVLLNGQPITENQLLVLHSQMLKKKKRSKKLREKKQKYPRIKDFMILNKDTPDEKTLCLICETAFKRYSEFLEHYQSHSDKETGETDYLFAEMKKNRKKMGLED